MAGKIVTVAQQKGGAGKTTLAAQLAVAFVTQGIRVALVDIDPQGSLARWFQARDQSGNAERLTCMALSGWRLPAALDRLKGSSDLVIIDSAAHVETDARIAVRAADLVIVPIQASPMDLWATEPTLALARAEKRAALIVLNRVQPGIRLGDALADRIAELGVAAADATLGNRTSFAASMLDGRGVIETAPKTKAAEEIIALAKEIMARLSG